MAFNTFASPHKVDEWTPEEREDNDPDWVVVLGYERTASGFRVILRERVDWSDGDGEEHADVVFDRPLLECPRHKKLYAAHFLNELLFEVAQKLKSAADAADSLMKDGGIFSHDAYRVQILEAGNKKIQVIRAVRSATNMGLKEAKDLVESNGVVVVNGREITDRLMRDLVASGATAAVLSN